MSSCTDWRLTSTASRNWYGRRSPAAAQRFVQAVDAAAQQIAAQPQAGPLFQNRYRWRRAGRFPYLLYYDIVAPDQVMILAVAHARRRPGYWRRRTP
jgi:plasmid stabilization system protein ParE